MYCITTYQATNQRHLKRRKESVHEQKKYPYVLCNFQATDQRSLKRHKELVVHEQKIYP